MSFAATKLLSLLVYPLSQVMLLLLLALICRQQHWPRVSHLALLLGIGWLYLCSSAFLADLLMGKLERQYPPRAMSVLPQADAIFGNGFQT